MSRRRIQRRTREGHHGDAVVHPSAPRLVLQPAGGASPIQTRSPVTIARQATRGRSSSAVAPRRAPRLSKGSSHDQLPVSSAANRSVRLVFAEQDDPKALAAVVALLQKLIATPGE